MDFLDGAEKGFCSVGCRRGCSEDGCEFFFGLENVLDCETAAVVFHFLRVDVDQREDVLDVPAFAVLVFGHEVCDFDSCARVEVFAEDAADSTTDAAAHGYGGVPPPCDGNYVRGRCRCSGGGGEAWVARLGEDLDVPDQHVHMRQDADTVLDGVEGFGLVGGSAGEYDGGGECEEG